MGLLPTVSKQVNLVQLKRGNGDKFALKEMDRQSVEQTDFMGQVLAERDIMVRGTD